METKEFYFDLPKNLIAQHPAERREAAKLMVLNPKEQKIYHENSINDMLNYINEDVFLVFNNSKVRKSRLYGRNKKRDIQVEFLILNRLDQFTFSSLVSKFKKQYIDEPFIFPDNIKAVVLEVRTDGIIIRFNEEIKEDYFERHGLIPLPPYIQRTYVETDEERYQTVYSRYIGSAAAVTAGLHFSESLLEKLIENNIEYDFVTLHVGLGTFIPVGTTLIEQNNMHSEDFFIEETVARRLELARTSGKKILAVGTTSLRVLESSYDFESKTFKVGKQKTSLFIYPGKSYDFRFVDMLFTNFHTPKSTLLMLVSSFAGKNFIFKAYSEAIKKHYSFFSYGDSTLFLNHI